MKREPLQGLNNPYPLDAVELLREAVALLHEAVRLLRENLLFQNGRPNRAADHQALAALLAEIWQTIGSHPFTLAELIESADAPLLAAIEGACGPLDNGTTRKLGRLFARSVGQVHAGFVLERAHASREGVVWTVRAA